MSTPESRRLTLKDRGRHRSYVGELLPPIPLSVGKLGMAIVLVAFGCTPARARTPEIGDGGLLSKTPCGPPCFFGIQPGVTTFSDAKLLLANRNLCKEPEDFDNEPSGGTRGFKCGLWLTASAFAEEDVISSLGFSTERPVQIVNIVSALGEPDAVAVRWIGLPESYRSIMLIYYDAQGMRLLLGEQSGGSYNVVPDSVVDRVVYLAPSLYSELRAQSEAWTGYGEYSPTE